MRYQVERLSPLQNAKVAALLVGGVSVIFVVPFTAAVLVTAPANGAPDRLMYVMCLLLPVAYAVLAFLSVLAGCGIYNIMFRHIGGFEYERHELKG